MPTILIEDGFRLYFFSNEGAEPKHVHIQYGGATAKFWINPVILAKNKGMNASELKRAARITLKHEKLISEKWDEFQSKKKS